MTEEIEKLTHEVSLMVARQDFQEGLTRIEKNQQTIYDKLTSSTEGIEKSHAQLVKGLLKDYNEFFRGKMKLVNLHHDELKRLTRQLKTKIMAYDVSIKNLAKLKREVNMTLTFYNAQIKKLNSEIKRYNGLVTELNAKILELQGGEKNE